MYFVTNTEGCYYIFMDVRAKNFIIFLVIAAAAFLSYFLWNLPPYGSPLNGAFVGLTIVLSITAFYWLIKVGEPKTSIVDFIQSLFSIL